MNRVIFTVRRVWLAILLVWILPFTGLSQEGDYYVSNFVIEANRIDNPYFSIERSEDGLVFVSNRSGILKYNGHTWKRISCPGAVYAMKRSRDTFFIGGKFGFGFIRDAPLNRSGFISLSDSLDQSESIYTVESMDHNIYLLGNRNMYVYHDTTFQLLATHHFRDSSEFTQLIKYKDQLYLFDESNRAYSVSGSAISPIDNPIPNNVQPLFLTTNSAGLSLLGTIENKLYLDDSTNFREVDLNDDNYLESNRMTSAVWLSDSLVAVGTLKGGLVILNSTDWSLKQIVNSHTGLSDNEILGMQTDLDNGLWVAQSNGLDRIAPFLPVSDFTHYPGLNGKVFSVHPNDSTIFVSTSMGVYFLSKVRNYTEVIDLIQRKVKVDKEVEVSRRQMRQSQQQRRNTATTQEIEPESTTTEADEDTTKRRKGLFSFLRRKDKEKEKQKKEEDPGQEETDKKPGILGRIFGPSTEILTVQEDSIFTEQKVQRELQSIRYTYQRVQGINTRTSIYQEYNEDLFVGGLGGLFLVSGDSSINITEEALRDILVTQSGLLIAAAVSGDIIFYQKNVLWEEVDRITDFSDVVLHLYEDYEGTIWLTGTDLVFKLNINETETTVDEFELNNPFSDRTVSIDAGTRLLFINPFGIYSLDKESGIIEQDTLVENYLGKIRKYFDSNREYLWVFNGEEWFKVGIQPGEKSTEVRLLNLLSNLTYVTFHEEGNAFWVVNSDNEIYRIDNIAETINSNYNLVVNEFENLGGFTSETVLEFAEKEGNIRFEYFHPDYSGVLGIEYRYRLEGLDQDWSDWSEDNLIQFPYLPPGDYRITIQSKDIFNQLNQSPTIRFKVVPPYWQQPWFYALEVLLFSSLFILSVRLNRSSNSRYLLLNRLLAFLTLIIMVEFVQAIAEWRFEIEDSPVVNFFIQVSVAGAILPLERILRKWLIGEIGAKKITEKADGGKEDIQLTTNS